MLDFLSYLTPKKKAKIRIEKPAEPPVAEESLQDQVRRYARMIPQEPDPNIGRVQEIKEEIKKGTYLKREMIEESALRLTQRFLRKDR